MSTTTTTTTTPSTAVTDVDATSAAVTIVTTVSNNMANLTSNLTANLTDLGGLPGEIEDQMNKTNASDHTYRSGSRLVVNNLTLTFCSQELYLCPECAG